MNHKNDGLTVGELTITIGVLIIIGVIWSTFTQKQESQEVSIKMTNGLEFLYHQASIKSLS
tara:strand:+ start:790 stop:972 length:183 start_codon:yes stop_codon:yes gene_type:complete